MSHAKVTLHFFGNFLDDLSYFQRSSLFQHSSGTESTSLSHRVCLKNKNTPLGGLLLLIDICRCVFLQAAGRGQSYGAGATKQPHAKLLFLHYCCGGITSIEDCEEAVRNVTEKLSCLVYARSTTQAQHSFFP